jgi:hypothetical protein
MSDAYSMKTKSLDQLIKALRGQLPHARVGILGDKTHRKAGTDSEKTNAQIGAKHEFGDDGMPIRSFLRVPITDHMQEFLNKSRFFDPVALKDVLRTGSIITWVKKIGIVGESVVAEGFATGGFGKWKPSNMARKKNHQTLVETQQLRNSITSDVKE